MREDHPRLTRRPSEYIREHVWFTTQPIEEPDDPQHLVSAIEQARLGDRLLFATDYPHWDFDSPKQALPRAMDASLRRAILFENALDLYLLQRACTSASVSVEGAMWSGGNLHSSRMPPMPSVADPTVPIGCELMDWRPAGGPFVPVAATAAAAVKMIANAIAIATSGFTTLLPTTTAHYREGSRHTLRISRARSRGSSATSAAAAVA